MCHCFRQWSVVLLPPIPLFRFLVLHVPLFLTPPVPLPLPLHLPVRVPLRLRNPLLGLILGFVGVVLVVVVVVRERARQMGVPQQGWRTQLGCATSVPNIHHHLQGNHRQQRFYPWRIVRKHEYRNERHAANAHNNQKQLPRRVGRHKK